MVPSLPGYGFSSAPTQPGFGINEMAKTFDQLMVSLGYTTYVAQGAVPASFLAPTHVIGSGVWLSGLLVLHKGTWAHPALCR